MFIHPLFIGNKIHLVFFFEYGVSPRDEGILGTAALKRNGHKMELGKDPGRLLYHLPDKGSGFGQGNPYHDQGAFFKLIGIIKSRLVQQQLDFGRGEIFGGNELIDPQFREFYGFALVYKFDVGNSRNGPFAAQLFGKHAQGNIGSFGGGNPYSEV
jgi:hypothetical protein